MHLYIYYVHLLCWHVQSCCFILIGTIFTCWCPYPCFHWELVLEYSSCCKSEHIILHVTLHLASSPGSEGLGMRLPYTLQHFCSKLHSSSALQLCRSTVQRRCWSLTCWLDTFWVCSLLQGFSVYSMVLLSPVCCIGSSFPQSYIVSIILLFCC